MGHERDVRRSVCHYDTPTLISLMSICVYGIISEHHYRDGLGHLITARLYRGPFTLDEDTIQVWSNASERKYTSLCCLQEPKVWFMPESLISTWNVCASMCVCLCMCVRGREIITRPQLLLWNWIGQSAKERKCGGKKKEWIKLPIVLTSLERLHFPMYTRENLSRSWTPANLTCWDQLRSVLHFGINCTPTGSANYW